MVLRFGRYVRYVTLVNIILEWFPTANRYAINNWAWKQ